MSPATHFFSGWVLANSVALSRRDRVLVTLACVVPDIDGLGIVVDLATRHTKHPTDWFSSFHHSLHTLLFAVIVTAISFPISRRSWKAVGFVFLSFHLHLLEDLIGSRGPDGYQWPIPYLVPFSHTADLSWSGQWALNGWPNFVITFLLLAVALYLAWYKGYSPLEMISKKADAVFVSTLRNRFSAT